MLWGLIICPHLPDKEQFTSISAEMLKFTYCVAIEYSCTQTVELGGALRGVFNYYSPDPSALTGCEDRIQKLLKIKGLCKNAIFIPFVDASPNMDLKNMHYITL